MPRARFLVSIALLASAGCAAATSESPNRPPIQTERIRYTVDDSMPIVHLTINMVYRNTTGSTVYLPTCQGPQPPRLQKQVGDAWVVAFAPNVMGCEQTPISVRAGETYPYSFQIVGGRPGSSFAPRFAVSELPGTYRVLWEIFRTSRETVAGRPPIMTDPVPVEQEISNSFQLISGR